MVLVGLRSDLGVKVKSDALAMEVIIILLFLKNYN